MKIPTVPLSQASLEDSSSCVAPFLRHVRAGQTERHEVSFPGQDATTRCSPVSVLGLSQPLDGSPPARLECIATQPDQVRTVSHELHLSSRRHRRAKASDPLLPHRFTRSVCALDLRVSRYAHTLRRIPLASSARTSPVVDRSLPSFTVRAASVTLRWRVPFCRSLSAVARSSSRRCSGCETECQIHIAVGRPTFSPSMGFLFPLEVCPCR